MTVWLATLVFFGFYVRKRSIGESFFIYTCILLISSPAITNQSLAIPIAYISIYPNPFSALYTFFGAIHLITDFDGLNLFGLTMELNVVRQNFYLILITLLGLSLIWRLKKDKILYTLKMTISNIQEQFH
jgi:hypothetical protein